MKWKSNLLAVMGVIFSLAVAGCTIEAPTPVPSPNAIQEAQLQDGYQSATLSWGRLNYNPEVLKVKKDIPVRLTADMRRLTGCYRVFEIPELGIEKRFTEKNNAIEFTPSKSGTFAFGCAMGMGRGTIIVE